MVLHPTGNVGNESGGLPLPFNPKLEEKEKENLLFIFLLFIEVG